MEIFWFCVVALMLVVYVVLDGFDLGAGMIHLWAARTDAERRTVLNAIGPVWDGNEVWLLAAGGTLYFAFPPVYASAFSGFYLPLMIVLWLLMMRGLGIELRHRVQHPLWKSFWDTVFSAGSVLLAVFFGAALGNLIRGVPLGEEGYFFEPLWTTFAPGPEPGVLDWFTVLMGLVAVCALLAHGAHYIALRTEGDLQLRARKAARYGAAGLALGSAAGLAAAASLRPDLRDNFAAHPWGWIFPLCALAGLAGMFYFQGRGRDRGAFLSSAAFIAGALGATAFGMFPVMLRSAADARHHLTVWNSATHAYGMETGLLWWIPGILLAAGYFAAVYYLHRGKLKLPAEGEGY
ncbi:MAG: cytochrome d ubiquinol oxidase subunit II [Bacteroidota bacterium]